MRICFVTTSVTTRCNSMKRALEMAKPLNECGHSVTIILEDHPDNRKALANKPEIYAHYFSKGGIFHERRQKLAYLRKNAFDLVYISCLSIRNAIQYKGKCLFIVEHAELESACSAGKWIKRCVQWYLEWWNLLAYDGFVCASKYLYYLFQHRLLVLKKKKPILWLPYAFDSTLLEMKKDDLCIPEKSHHKKLILFFGSIVEGYGCLFFLESLFHLYQKRQDWVAVFFGEGKDRKKAMNLVRKHERSSVIQFPGYVSDEKLSQYIMAADVTLAHLNNTAQDWARCSSKIFMYMANQKPIVSAQISDNSEVLRESAFYYDEENPHSMAEAIDKALSVDPTWTPHYNLNDHTWMTRTRAFLNWIDDAFKQKKYKLDRDPT